MKKIFTLSLVFKFLVVLAIQNNKGVTMDRDKTVFTENKGQVADESGKSRDDIYFSTAFSGGKMFIGKTGLHYQWQATKESDTANENCVHSSEFYRVDVNLLNASAPTQIIKESQSSWYNNYYLGNCPQGVTGVYSYGKVTLQNVYHHIDWVFHTLDNKAEYDFVVQPGGNPNDIALQIEGASVISLTTDGSLLISSPLGSSEQLAPKSYQDGQLLHSKFILDGNILRIAVDGYNPAVALNIDPVIQTWGTYFGGTGDEQINDTKIDISGNLYACGFTTSSSGISSGGYQNSLGGATDGFLAKFNAAGGLLWATYYGGSDNDYAFGCGPDASGNVFLSGSTNSSNVIHYNTPLTGLDSIPAGKVAAGFLAKFNSAGTLQWGTYVGGIQALFNTGTLNWDLSGATSGFGCSVDALSNVIMCGRDNLQKTCLNQNSVYVNCPNIYTATAGSYQDTTLYVGYGNPFVAKYDANGNKLWATYYGESSNGLSYIFNGGGDLLFCSTDPAGNVYLAGSADSSVVGNSLGYLGFQNTCGSGQDDWLVKFSAAGSRIWSTYYGGYGTELIGGLCTDYANNVYLSGTTTTSNSTGHIATTGTFMSQIPNVGTQAAFVVKFNAGGARQLGTYFGDVFQCYGSQIAVDDSQRVILTAHGTFASSWYMQYCASEAALYGTIIARLSSTFQRDWAASYSSQLMTGWYYPMACAVTHNGKSIYMADWTTWSDPNVPLNAHQSAIAGGYDGYILCFRDSAIFDTISGYVFSDLNGNGIQDPGEGFMANYLVGYSDNGVAYNQYTNTSGFYQFIVPRWGTSGYCYGNLAAATYSSGTVISVPVSGIYNPDVTNGTSQCCYVFGVSPAINIKGTVYYDSNHDAVLDNAEPGIPQQSVSFNSLWQAFTSDDGTYNALIPIGSYTETFDHLDAYNTSTYNPASYSISSGIGGTLFSGKNFGAYFTPSFVNSEVQIFQTGIPPVVGQNFDFQVQVNNIATVPTPDTLVFHYDSLLVYNGSLTGVTNNTAKHTLTLITNDIVPARYSGYFFSFNVPSSVPVGTILHDWVTVSPDSIPDIDTTNNRADDYVMVLASYDPNNKNDNSNTSDPAKQTARLWHHGGSDYVTYVVNFQNTGTYTAFNVVINDTLPLQLDAGTVRFLKSSSHCDAVRNGQILNFKFSNINLPTERSDTAASSGYVVFQVKTATSAYPGDSIVNHAAIYFDYNSAVITKNNIIHFVGNGACSDTIMINVYDTACSFSNYVFEGDTIHAPGTYYSRIMPASSGCDSVRILHAIKVITSNNTVTVYNREFCAGGYAIYKGDTIRGHLLVQDTLTSITGCDSLVDYSFFPTSSIVTTFWDTLRRVGPYYFADTAIYWPGYNPYYAFTYYSPHYTSSQGCDSSAQLQLYFNVRSGHTIDTICSLDTYYYGDDSLNAADFISHHPYFNNGTTYGVMDTLHLNSYDSVLTVYLTIRFPHYLVTNLPTSLPCGRSGSGSNPVYTSPHSVFTATPLASGCSDVQVTNYTPQETYFFIYICPGDSFLFGGKWRKAPYLNDQYRYIDTFQTLCGSDSIVTLYLSSDTLYFGDYIYKEVCPGDSFNFRGGNYGPGNVTVRFSGPCMDTIYNIYVYELDTSHYHVFTTPTCIGTRTWEKDHYVLFQQPFSYMDTGYTHSMFLPCVDTVTPYYTVYNYVRDTLPGQCRFQVEYDSVVYPNCQNANNGLLRARGWGGTAPYHYKWSTGDTTRQISGLTYGNYTVTVYDAVGDSLIPYHAFIDNNNSYVIMGPSAWESSGWGFTFQTFDSLPQIYYSIQVPDLCFSGNRDTSFLYVYWGTTPNLLSYEGHFDTTYTNGYELTDLGAGYHHFTLTNGSGCVDTFNIYIPGDKMQFTNVTPAACNGTGAVTAINYNCYEWNNPHITLNITGYDSVLHYNRFNGSDTLLNLNAGWHYYTVSNTVGCSNTDSFLVPVISAFTVAWNGGNDTVVLSSGNVVLSGATPAGGTYSGPGVQAGVFNPVQVGPGSYRITYSYTNASGCTDSVSRTFVVVVVTGIGNASSLFWLYPNPADDYTLVDFDLSFTGAFLTIKDVTGRVLITTRLTTSPQRLETGTLPSGIYIVTVNQHGQQSTKMLVKE